MGYHPSNEEHAPIVGEAQLLAYVDGLCQASRRAWLGALCNAMRNAARKGLEIEMRSAVDRSLVQRFLPPEEPAVRRRPIVIYCEEGEDAEIGSKPWHLARLWRFLDGDGRAMKRRHEEIRREIAWLMEERNFRRASRGYFPRHSLTDEPATCAEDEGAQAAPGAEVDASV